MAARIRLLSGCCQRLRRHLDEQRAAQSRHAMAEIAYAQLRKDEGAYVLAAWALADFGADGGSGSAQHAARLAGTRRSSNPSTSRAKNVRRARATRCCSASRSARRRFRFGSREVPRFDILRGFMEFRTGHSSEANGATSRRRPGNASAAGLGMRRARAPEHRDYWLRKRGTTRWRCRRISDALEALPPDLDPTADRGYLGQLRPACRRSAGLFRQAEESHRTSIRLHANMDDCDGTRMSVARLGTLLVQVGSIGEGRIYLVARRCARMPVLIDGGKRESAADSARSRQHRRATMPASRRVPRRHRTRAR